MGIEKPISDITEQDLFDLVGSSIPEGRTIEYKQELALSSDSEKKELLADISSFANASGGHLLFGIFETSGVASAIPGLTGIDPDKEILRIEALARDGISPRIPGLAIKAISLANGTHVIIVHVPNSWASPHMVTLRGSSRFLTRTSAGKHQMDVSEIRDAFLLSDSLAQKIRDFHIDRLNKLSRRDVPFTLHNAPLIALHIVPLSAFQAPPRIEISSIANDWYRLPQIYGQASGYRINLDGIVTYMNLRDDTVGTYTQLFRNGIVEAINAHLLEREGEDRKLIPSVSFEARIVEACDGILRFLQSIAIDPPLYLFLALIGVKGYTMGLSSEKLFRSPPQFIREVDRDLLLLPEVLFDTYPSQSAASALRGTFDAVWNAAGWPRSMNYDENGNWREWN